MVVDIFPPNYVDATVGSTLQIILLMGIYRACITCGQTQNNKTLTCEPVVVAVVDVVNTFDFFPAPQRQRREFGHIGKWIMLNGEMNWEDECSVQIDFVSSLTLDTTFS